MSLFYFHGANAGLQPGYQPTEIDPARFRAMAPALQTEAILMMVDQKVSVPVMVKATGLAPQEMIKIGRARHRLRLEKPEVVAGDGYRSTRRDPGGLPINAERALLWFAEQVGPVKISYLALEAAANLGHNGGRYSLPWLIDQSFVEEIIPPLKRVPGVYRLTDAGRGMATIILARRAAESTEAADA